MPWLTTPVSLCYSNDLQLEIQKRHCYLKNVALDFVLLVLKLCPIQAVISLPLWIKLTMGQLVLFFLCNSSSSFQLWGGIHLTNHFSLLLFGRYILAIQQIITRSICNTLDLYQSSELPQRPWHHGHNNRKWLKQPQSHFYWAVPSKSFHFRCLMYALYGHSRSFKFKRKYQQYGPCFQNIFPFLMTML